MNLTIPKDIVKDLQTPPKQSDIDKTMQEISRFIGFDITNEKEIKRFQDKHNI